MASSKTQLITIESADLQKLKGRMTKAQKELIGDVTARFKEHRDILNIALTSEAQSSFSEESTGETARSINVAVQGGGTKDVRIVATVGNAKRPPVVINTILFGSKKHPIDPKKPGGVLAFFWKKKGEMVFLKHVEHPGTKPNNFVKRAWERTAAQRTAMTRAIGKLVVEKIAKGG